MEQEETYPIQLIDNFLRGVATKAEQSLLLVWRGARAEHEKYFEQVQRIYQLTNKKNEEFVPNTNAAWQRMQARIAESEGQERKISKPKPKVIQLNPWIKVAASILITVGLSVWAFNSWKQRSAMVEVASGQERKMIYLPDSSQVWLQANTKVSYASDFNDNNRKVTLDGEAFFEVKKKNGMPFKVLGNRTVTEVLGTSFLVKAYKKSAAEEIEVVTGKVSFSSLADKSESVILLPGNAAIYKDGEPMEKRNMETKNSMFLKTARLSFNDERLSVIIAVLQEDYKEKILLQHTAIGDCRFTGTFEKSSLEEILKVLALAVNVQVSKSEDGYLLTGAGCEPLSP